MSIQKTFLLPGLEKQFGFIQKQLNSKIQSILVIGSSSEFVADQMIKIFSNNVELIVEDYESLMNSKIVLGADSKVKVSLMNFEITDFDSASFDLVYAQASISLTKRNKIIKEIKRILKPTGFLCVGELVSLTKEVPQFVKDTFDSSDLLPLYIDELDKYYQERKFEIIAKDDLTSTLKDYYLESVTLLSNVKHNLTDKEKSFYKKLLSKVSHESNVYLKLGGDKYIGFIAMFLQKGD